MDQEMKAYLDEQFGRMEERSVQQGERLIRLEEHAVQQGERLTRLEEHAVQQGERLVGLEERVTENSRQIEGLQEESRHTRVLIEGVWNHVRLLAEGVVGVTERLEAHQNEVQKGFEDVKASVALPYQDLDRRVRWLENREERKDRDIFEFIHEEFGIPKKSS